MTTEQLKNSILQLAISGNLVSQEPSDEPAHILLERICKEKKRLIKEGKIKKEKNASFIFRDDEKNYYEKIDDNEPTDLIDEIPFEIPDNWEWVRFKNLISLISGTSYKKGDVQNSGIRILRGGNIQNFELVLDDTDVFLPNEYYDAEKCVSAGDVILVASTGSKAVIGKPAPITKDYSKTQIGAFLRIARPISSEIALWSQVIFQSDYYRSHIRDNVQGTNINNIKAEYIEELLVPVPPLAEQSRIIEKLSEIDPYINEYNTKEIQRSELYEAFPDLLKKSILRQAVQGKLVSQNPGDEPVSVLLEHIKAEKEQMIAAGIIKQNKNESTINKHDGSYYEKANGTEKCIDDEIPFEIPDSWAWIRLGSLIKIESGKALSAHQMRPGTVPVYGGNGITGYHDEALVTEETIVIGRVGYYCGSIHVTEENAWITDNAFITTYPKMSIDREYLVYCLRFMDLGRNNNATAQPVVSGKKIYPMLFPLPPLQEQKRIANKLAEILPICEALKS